MTFSRTVFLFLVWLGPIAATSNAAVDGQTSGPCRQLLEEHSPSANAPMPSPSAMAYIRLTKHLLNEVPESSDQILSAMQSTQPSPPIVSLNPSSFELQLLAKFKPLIDKVSSSDWEFIRDQLAQGLTVLGEQSVQKENALAESGPLISIRKVLFQLPDKFGLHGPDIAQFASDHTIFVPEVRISSEGNPVVVLIGQFSENDATEYYDLAKGTVQSFNRSVNGDALVKDRKISRFQLLSTLKGSGNLRYIIKQNPSWSLSRLWPFNLGRDSKKDSAVYELDPDAVFPHGTKIAKPLLDSDEVASLNPEPVTPSIHSRVRHNGRWIEMRKREGTAYDFIDLETGRNVGYYLLPNYSEINREMKVDDLISYKGQLILSYLDYNAVSNEFYFVLALPLLHGEPFLRVPIFWNPHVVPSHPFPMFVKTKDGLAVPIFNDDELTFYYLEGYGFSGRGEP